MLSLDQNEYLIFLSNYFKVNPKTILQKSFDNKIIDTSDSEEIIISKLKSSLGYQRRLLEPLSVALTKSAPFDTIVYLYAFKEFEKHYSLLVADADNIFKLIFFKSSDEDHLFKTGSILKINSCYFKEGRLLTNQAPKDIWFCDFRTIFTVREYYLDNLPECIYDEKYTKITNFVTIVGYFYIVTKSDKNFCFIHSKELQIRFIPFKLEELDQSVSTKLVRITFCELDYGPDAYQLKMSEFSEFTVLSSIPLVFTPEKFKSLIRFEYPAYRMALSELTEKTVAITKIKLLKVDKIESSWNFYGYDCSQAVCLTVFDDLFAEQLTSLISDDTILLIDGIYRRGRKYYMRERISNIHPIIIEDEEEITIPVSNPEHIIEEKLIIIDIVVTEILEKFYLTRDNKQENYEKVKGVSHNIQITVNNYNKKYYQKFFVGNSYRLFFLKSKFFSGNIYFIMNSNSSLIVL